MRNVQIDVPEFGVGLVDHHNFVRSLNKIERLKADKDQELWDVQLTRDAVRTPRASGSALASLKRSTIKGFRFGLFKSAVRHRRCHLECSPSQDAPCHRLLDRQTVEGNPASSYRSDEARLH
jgi:hypothetical protein